MIYLVILAFVFQLSTVVSLEIQKTEFTINEKNIVPTSSPTPPPSLSEDCPPEAVETIMKYTKDGLDQAMKETTVFVGGQYLANFEHPSVAMEHIKHCTRLINSDTFEKGDKHIRHCQQVVTKAKNWAKENFDESMCAELVELTKPSLMTQGLIFWFKYTFSYRFSYKFRYTWDLSSQDVPSFDEAMAYNLGKLIYGRKNNEFLEYWNKNVLGSNSIKFSGMAYKCMAEIDG